MEKYQSIANRLYEVIQGNLSTFECWGFYLLSDEFDSEPELRNKVAVLWICALLDSVEAQKKALQRAIDEAERGGFDSLAENGRQLQNFCVLIAEFLGNFTKEEQIYMVDCRNQWVHSYLVNRHNDEVAIKYCADGNLCDGKMPSDEYHALLRSFHAKGESLDDVLTPITGRALEVKKYRYWDALSKWQKDKDAIYKVFLNGDTIRIDI